MLEKTKKCPFCAEEINEIAIKCKHCGSDLIVQNKKDVKASNHSSYAAFSIICFLLPIVGIILGIVYLTKKDALDRKLGEHCISFSILMIILIPAIFIFFTFFQTLSSGRLF